ncbi:GNAT family N-acetyltransferase [Halorubrum vacuolatum]|uniref:Acetyltransferase (GNAT) domain-containing protein n=1 Tax=Halorubrum vacuolatum TaxID=63740 RepID=A0A238W587_HALVU|nr:GNAT family N-acetyltransferase [Halorubrum vacuolatum]SNR41696.1 Acetyltransferase (GNAT) domain-containing protein [Halorubrum vacuolatum]
MTDPINGTAFMLPDGYRLREGTPSISEFRRIRRLAGMTDRPPEGLEVGLPNTTYGVCAVYKGDGQDGNAEVGGEAGDAEVGGEAGDAEVGGEAGDDRTVGMARIVGDGGTAFLIVDVAVEPSHQGQGIGSAMFDALMTWLSDHAPPGGYVYLFADVDGFYERWGFEESAPASKGMWIRTGDL